MVALKDAMLEKNLVHCLDLKTVLLLDSRMGSGMASLSGSGRVVWLDLALASKKDFSSGEMWGCEKVRLLGLSSGL